MMHSYQHNIKTFNSETRHLTRVERSLYRDAIELYYDTEQPLPADDFSWLCRKLMARSEEEKQSLQCILDEFFERTGDVWSHDYCDEQIEKYKEAKSAKARAGKASAEARRKKTAARKRARRTNNEQESTGAEQVLNTTSTEGQQNPTNKKPITNNQLKEKTKEKKKSPNPDDLDLAMWIWSHVDKLAPGQRKPSFNGWAEDLRKMKEIDHRLPEDIKAVFLWAHNDDFWKTNIRSPAKLRAKFDDLNAKRINTNHKQAPKGKANEDFSGKTYTGTPAEEISWLR